MIASAKAAINGHASTVELLISRGANVTQKDARFEATPDGWAEEGAHSQIADTLRRVDEPPNPGLQRMGLRPAAESQHH